MVNGEGQERVQVLKNARDGASTLFALAGVACAIVGMHAYHSHRVFLRKMRR